MKIAWLGAAFAAALARPVDASCAYIEQVDQLISGDGIVAVDGAVLVGHGPHGPSPAGGAKHAARAEDWKVVDGSGAPADVKLVELAPGIRAFVRTKPAKAKSKLVIKDDAGTIGTFTYDDVKLELPAPAASKARVTWAKAFRGTRSTFQVDVASVPDAAMYVVVTGKGGSKSAVVVPHAAGAQTLVPHQSAGHCDSGSPGSAPSDGEEITLAWMDRYGRIGPASTSIKASNKR